MVVEIMRVGRARAPSTPCCDKIFEFYDQEVEATTQALTSLIEPLISPRPGGISGP